jgi:hypothetical protein
VDITCIIHSTLGGFCLISRPVFLRLVSVGSPMNRYVIMISPRIWANSNFLGGSAQTFVPFTSLEWRHHVSLSLMFIRNSLVMIVSVKGG